MDTLRVSRRCKILWRTRWWRNFERARTSARAPVEYSAIRGKIHDISRFVQHWRYTRAPHAGWRAHPIFFSERKKHFKISLQIFFLGYIFKIHNSGSNWNLLASWKNSFFRSKITIFNILWKNQFLRSKIWNFNGFQITWFGWVWRPR